MRTRTEGRRFARAILSLSLLATLILSGCQPGGSTVTVPHVAKKRMDASVTLAIDAESVMDRAANWNEQSRYREAELCLKPLLLVHSDHSGGLFLLAQAKAGQGELENAVKTLETIPPDDPQLGLAALGQAADWLIQLARYRDAESKLRQLLQRAPDVSIAQRRIAQLLNNQGRRIQAAPHLRKLAELGDASPEELYGMISFSDPFMHTNFDGTDLVVPTLGLAEARLLHHQSESRAAQKMVESLLHEQPRSAAIAAFSLRLAAEMQDQASFDRTLRALPEGIVEQPEYWYAMGISNQRRELHDVAIRCFLEAVLLDDTDRSSFLAMARSLRARHRDAEAAGLLERYEILDEIASINIAPHRTDEQMQRMPMLLRELHRDAEANAWERIARRGAPPHAIPQSHPNIATSCSQPDPLWATCGILVDDWPLPNVAEQSPQKPAHRERELDGSTEQSIPQAFSLIDVTDDVGLEFQYQPGPDQDRESLLMPETVGDGIAVIDFDLDGWPDLYFTQGGGKAFESEGSLPNRLWRNRGGQAFIDATSASGTGDHGYGQGVAAADIDQDGFLDLIVANIGPNVLYHNNGDGTFSRSELASSDPGGNQWTTTIACGDVTGDGLPEIVEINYIDDPAALVAECIGSAKFPLCNPQQYHPAEDRILLNRGDGKFERWTTADSDRPAGYGFAAIIANFDGHAGNDLFIANDTSGNEFWVSQSEAWVSQSEGSTGNRFGLVEEAELFGIAHGPQGISLSSMGIAAGDFDRNGRLDLQITNYANEAADLFLQQPTGFFSNENFHYGLDESTKAPLGWGTQAADLDHDGWLDIVVLNGSLYSQSDDGVPYRMAPQVIRGRPGHFRDVNTASLGDPFWTTPTLGRTLATVDWNRDGQVDFVATHLDAPAALLQNDTASEAVEPDLNHWVQFDLVGTQSERDAVGSVVTVHCGDQSWSAWVTGGDGFLCSNDPVLSIGVGAQRQIDSIEIRWSSGKIETFEATAVDHRYLVVEGGDALHAW